MANTELDSIQRMAVDYAHDSISTGYGNLSTIRPPDRDKHPGAIISDMLPHDGITTPFEFKRLAVWHAHLLRVSSYAVGIQSDFVDSRAEGDYSDFLNEAPADFRALCKSPAGQTYAFSYVRFVSSKTYYETLANYAKYARFTLDWKGIDKGIAIGKYVDLLASEFLSFEERLLSTDSLDVFLMSRIKEAADAAIAGFVRQDLLLSEEEFGLKYAYLARTSGDVGENDG